MVDAFMEIFNMSNMQCLILRIGYWFSILMPLILQLETISLCSLIFLKVNSKLHTVSKRY